MSLEAEVQELRLKHKTLNAIFVSFPRSRVGMHITTYHSQFTFNNPPQPR